MMFVVMNPPSRSCTAHMYTSIDSTMHKSLNCRDGWMDTKINRCMDVWISVSLKIYALLNLSRVIETLDYEQICNYLIKKKYIVDSRQLSYIPPLNSTRSS